MFTIRTRFVVPLLALALLTGLAAFASSDPGLGYADLMKVQKITHRTVSDDGEWVAYAVMPDRGDGEGFVRAVDRGTEHVVERGSAPQLTTDGAWVGFRVEPSFAEQEGAADDDSPRAGMTLLRTSDGERWSFEEVEGFGFSDDGAWIAVHHAVPKKDDEDEEVAEGAGAVAVEPDSSTVASTEVEGGVSEDEEEEKKEREAGGSLELVRLVDQEIFAVEHVKAWSFDPTSGLLAVAIATPTGEGNGLFVYPLDGDPQAREVMAAPRSAVAAMAWAEETAQLAFLFGAEEEPDTVTDVSLHLLDTATGPSREVPPPPSRVYPAKNQLTWSRDGERVFVGLRPADAEDEAKAETEGEADEDVGAAGESGTEEEPVDPYDFEAILEDRGVDVWHWNDPRIKTNERSTWKERSEHLYLAVVHVADATLVPLADETMPEIRIGPSSVRVLGSSSERWLQLMTWDGFYSDAFAVDLQTGERYPIVERIQDTISLSPGGGFAVYFHDGQWMLADLDRKEHRDLTSDLGVPFADEDHDYPRTAPDYGVGGWAADDSAVLIYDKFDVWWMPTSARQGERTRLTQGRGRDEQRTYRVVDLDDEKDGFDPGERLLLTGFDRRAQHSSLWRGTMGEPGLRKLREEDAKVIRVLAKAKDAERILYTEESYTEFPDLWVSDPDFKRRKSMSRVNPQLEDFDLGRSELVEWRSLDGIPLQGVLIKPANYRSGERYPVLVYFYRFMSQRLNNFNDPVINHRPSFYAYAGDGYCVFLPDIRFEVGRPGLAATKSLVPGVQHLIDIGIADPDAIALHGHSWSGYQAAQIITHTDIFACAVAGAPVSNMTSAYGGIRWGTGLARQFQYEKSQSRLGVSLWEGRDRYIDNSPLFFADQIDTPLLIQFGDEDEAVPWTQGIELYLAMRRLGKPAVMLQYHGEPHHLKKYANKLDYSLKMKAFIDHYCKGAPAPEWWTEGVPFEGE